MRKLLKENKGFSLVELLVAILIMAVIAGTAITLFGGVLNSSRTSADAETAESIKRAVLTYMNTTNDTDLSCLGVADGTTTSDNLIKYLGLQIKIDGGASAGTATFTRPGGVDPSSPKPTTGVSVDASDIRGTFGPFIDLTKEMNPKTPGTDGWVIKIDKTMQVVSVTVSTTDDSIEPNVTFVTGS